MYDCTKDQAKEKKEYDLKPDISRPKYLHIPEKFQLILSNKFAVLMLGEQADVEETGNNIKDINTKHAYEVLGYNKKPQEKWICQDAWQAVKERKACKPRMLNAVEENMQSQHKEDDRLLLNKLLKDQPTGISESSSTSRMFPGGGLPWVTV